MLLSTKVSAACVLIGCLLFGGCSWGDTVVGSGHVKAEPRPVGHFKEIELSGSGDLIVRQTGTESASIEAEDNLLPLVKAEVVGDRLELGLRSGMSVHATRPMIYRVTVKELSALSLSGSGSTKGSGIDTPELIVRISGSGEVELAGKAQDQEVHISGSGSYSAKDLDGENVRIDVSGSGNANVRAAGTLDVTISGSGTVEYSGNPAVTQHVSGSGSVIHRQ